jgi:hypothetical protein
MKMDKNFLTPESKANLRKGDFIINTVNGDIVIVEEPVDWGILSIVYKHQQDNTIIDRMFYLDTKFICNIGTWRLATHEEKNEFIQELKEHGHEWDEDEKEVYYGGKRTPIDFKNNPPNKNDIIVRSDGLIYAEYHQMNCTKEIFFGKLCLFSDRMNLYDFHIIDDMAYTDDLEWYHANEREIEEFNKLRKTKK